MRVLRDPTTTACAGTCPRTTDGRTAPGGARRSTSARSTSARRHGLRSTSVAHAAPQRPPQHRCPTSARYGHPLSSQSGTRSHRTGTRRAQDAETRADWRSARADAGSTSARPPQRLSTASAVSMSHFGSVWPCFTAPKWDTEPSNWDAQGLECRDEGRLAQAQAQARAQARGRMSRVRRGARDPTAASRAGRESERGSPARWGAWAPPPPG